MGNMICPACSQRTSTVTFFCEHCRTQLYPPWHVFLPALVLLMAFCSVMIYFLLSFAFTRLSF